MKKIMGEFAALEPFNEDEEEVVEDLNKELLKAPQSWQYLCGIAEGVNIVTRLHPFASYDTNFRLVARVVMIATARLALKAIQEAEDSETESFPEEL